MKEITNVNVILHNSKNLIENVIRNMILNKMETTFDGFIRIL